MDNESMKKVISLENINRVKTGKRTPDKTHLRYLEKLAGTFTDGKVRWYPLSHKSTINHETLEFLHKCR